MIDLETIDREINELEARGLNSNPLKPVSTLSASRYTALNTRKRYASSPGRFNHGGKNFDNLPFFYLSAPIRVFCFSLIKPRTVGVVISSCTPLKIIGAVILLIFIFMVHFWKIVFIAAKCLGNKTMHPERFLNAIAAELDIHISAFLCSLRNLGPFNKSSKSVVSVQASNVSKVGNLVFPLVAVNINPFFIHNFSC